MAKNDLSKVAAGKALGVSDPTIYDWIVGNKRPKAHHREAIAVWTRDEVPADSWRWANERGEVAKVRPFEPASGVALPESDDKTGTDGDSS